MLKNLIAAALTAATLTATFAAAYAPPAAENDGGAFSPGAPRELGEFTVTAYCSCKKCCGKWSGLPMSFPTQSGGRFPVDGYTVSADPAVIPLGSVIGIEGLGTRYVHDTGGKIKGDRLDVYFAEHADALEFGKKKLDVVIYERGEP